MSEPSALAFDERQYSIAQLDALANGLAITLEHRGVRAGDRVALMSSNPARVLGLPGGTLSEGALADVTVNDTVNGARATLGSSGNATIAMTGTWPRGITLNTSTGAVSITALARG